MVCVDMDIKIFLFCFSEKNEEKPAKMDMVGSFEIVSHNTQKAFPSSSSQNMPNPEQTGDCDGPSVTSSTC